ncbi:MAG: YifB family Mg chelatase-like AAA ATPase [Saccharofermentans sp.]|nr:YifB family Mg chelatase-like AAA ATPase [Saccharofermentans sp.]
MAATLKLSKVYSSFVEGISATLSEIEVSVTPGIPTFDIIGLCDASIKESYGRIRSALITSGFSMPRGHITVGISPAYIKKSGTSFDLAIACGILFASGQLSQPDCKVYLEGELSLTGKVKATPACAVRLCSISEDKPDIVIIPSGSVKSAECAGIRAMTVETLSDLREIFLYGVYEPVDYRKEEFLQAPASEIDLSELKGQQKAKRALIIAAAGNHTVLLLGSPGCGKTMAGKIISGIMPPLERDEASDIFSVNELLECGDKSGLITRPYRYIDQNITVTGLIGNSRKLTPGELALANHGVLFADEITEFQRPVLDMLRLPLENRSVTIYSDGRRYRFPANYVFVAAGNPCKCGYAFEGGSKCRCTKNARKKYLSRLSGPFLDRMDLICEMTSIDKTAKRSILEDEKTEKESPQAAKAVSLARQMQKERYKSFGKDTYNSNVICANYADIMRLPAKAIDHLESLSDKGLVSARGYLGIIRVARTIADLEGRDDISEEDVDEAVMFRRMESCL